MIEPDELRALCQRIIQSGELGRSRTYAAILEYLAEQAIAGASPKEVSIAMDVLGRGSDFDVGKDSIVRVHVYHLRNKLDAYYARHGRKEAWRIDIPKGQYMLSATRNEQEPAAQGGRSITGQALQRRSFAPWLALLAAVLLGLNYWQQSEEQQPAAANPYAATAVWAPVLGDDAPVLILVGDYYIMGELDEAGLVRRMVREFDVDSEQDLRQAQQGGRHGNYLNLDLSYTPTSSASALLQVLKVFGADSGRVSVKLMSDFSTSDLVGKHVIYIGLLSGLRSLQDILFSASGLVTGLTYDELIRLDDNRSFTSSSGLSTGPSGYRDYGLLSSFPAPSGKRLLFLAGMRDEGLGNLAEAVTALSSLQELQDVLVREGGADALAAFEALYEVRGFSNTNFDASLVYSAGLDTRVLWENRLLDSP
jgi:hypothetical protein